MKSAPESPDEKPVLLFKSQKEWAAWLEKNHAKSSGVWLQLAKKAATLKTVSYSEAVETALCHGWIDGQVKRHDESVYIQKFIPRARKSIWSKINREKALALIRSGEMKPGGLAEIERAKADGRWDAAYDSPTTAMVPEDFRKALNENKKAKGFFATLNSQNRYAFLFRVQTTLKADTREKKIQLFMEMLAKGEKFHP